MPSNPQQDLDDKDLLATNWEASKVATKFYELASYTAAATQLKPLLAELAGLHRKILALTDRTPSTRHSRCLCEHWARMSYKHAQSALQASETRLISLLLEIEMRQRQELLSTLKKLTNQQLQLALSAQIASLQMIIDRLLQRKFAHKELRHFQQDSTSTR